ncbi:MAG: Ig-like domain-containing protein [Gemmatimonadetes bacterium]|nr:Ig-like domain-containing protein [Gemmatimonadota bacterium]
MRPLARLAVVAAAWSCASASIPPGGPETYDPPKVLRARPDTNAVNVRAGGVTYSFDKVVSERPVGAADLGALFLISPSHGAPNVSWRRTTISVSPKGGFRPNTTYRVRMLSGLADLEGNVDSTGSVIVFSTGATIARGNLRGIVFDWMAEKVAPQAFIEAFPLPTDRDSTRYIAQADSMGRFDLGNVPAGRYVLRASVDQNKNRYLDPRELYDTMTVTLADSLRREILTYVHDTIGAGIQTVTIVDSLTLRVQMDRALDTTFVIDTTHFTLRAKDSTLVRIARALSRRADDARREDSLRTKAIQDSVQKAAKADSAKADSAKGDTARAPRPAPPRRRAAPSPRRLGVRWTRSSRA